MDNLIASVALFTNPTVIARQIMAGLARRPAFSRASGLSLIFGISRIINFAGGDTSCWAPILPIASLVPHKPIYLRSSSCYSRLHCRLCYSFCCFQMAGVAPDLSFSSSLPAAGDLWPCAHFERCRAFDRGPAEKSVQLPVALEGFVRPFGVTFPVYRVALISQSASPSGIGLRLCSIAPAGELWFGLLGLTAETLSASGTDTRKIFTMVFGLRAALAGLAGGLATPLVSVGPGLHAEVLTDAF